MTIALYHQMTQYSATNSHARRHLMIINKKQTLLWLPICLLLSINLNTKAETIETIEYKNYLISPRFPQEIKPELMRNTPIRERGGSFNGHTDWYIDWQYQTRQEPTICRIHNIQIKVHVIHTLPALSEYVTDKQTITVFNKFNSALTQHEKNHGNNGLLAAREIDKAISEMQPQQNCRYISRTIDDIGNTIVQKYIFADREYDRVTQGGLSEGAVIY
jgi:predicted secreted Zn-dependent protease